MNKKFNKKSLKFGSLATALTVVFIAIIIIINMAATWVVNSFAVKIDLTENKVYQLSDDTVNYIRGLNDTIKITLLAPETKFAGSKLTARIDEGLQNFAKLSDGKIQIQYIDIDKDPQFAQKYSKDGKLSKTSVIIESSKRFKIVNMTTFYDTKYDSNGNISSSAFTLEQVVASSIMYVVSDNLPKVYFIKGHNEYEPAEMKKIFTNNNFAVSDLNLEQKNIDKNTAALVIAAPTRDYTAEEVDKIDTYLQSGGNLLVFMDPSQVKLTLLEGYLTEWGVKVGDSRKICDEDKSRNGDVTQIIASDMNTVYTTDISSNSIIVMPSTRRLETLFTEKDARTVQQVFTSSSSSYVKQNPQSKQVLFEDGDTKGPFIVATQTTKTRYVDNKPIVSHVFVSGSTAFISDDALTASNFANADVVANMVPVIRGEDKTSYVVRTKNIEDRPLTITSDVAPILYILLLVITLSVLVVGFVTWMRRRHL